MSNQRELIKLAFELLRYTRSVASFERNEEIDSAIGKLHKALAEQPVHQDVVAWESGRGMLHHDKEDASRGGADVIRPLVYGDVPQPKCEWVGLTLDEINELSTTHFGTNILRWWEDTVTGFANAVEATLKERNT